jgi:phage tail sheath protein FI
VKCDEETNPPDSIAMGQLIAVVGLAISRPAEFVIFKIGQSQSGSQVEAL